MSISLMRTKYPTRLHLVLVPHQNLTDILTALPLHRVPHKRCLPHRTTQECGVPTKVGEKYTSLEYHASKRNRGFHTVSARIEFRRLPLLWLPPRQAVSRSHTIGLSASVQSAHHHGRRKALLSRAV